MEEEEAACNAHIKELDDKIKGVDEELAQTVAATEAETARIAEIEVGGSYSMSWS